MEGAHIAGAMQLNCRPSPRAGFRLLVPGSVPSPTIRSPFHPPSSRQKKQSCKIISCVSNDGSCEISGYKHQPSEKKPQHHGKNRIFPRHTVSQAKEDTGNSESCPLSPPLGQCTLNKTPEKKLLSDPGKNRDKEEVSRSTLPEKWFHRSIYEAHQPTNRTHREKSTQQESPEKNRDAKHAENEPGFIRSHPFGHR